MPGTGPAPSEKRRRTNEPARGDWVELGPLEKSVLPDLPRRAKGEGAWPAMTRLAWESWRQDPVTSQYSISDIAYALDTIRLHAVMTPSTAGEVRLRMDALGLTPKGKRDNRWRITTDPPEPEKPKRSSRSGRRRAHLTAVK